MSNTWMSNKVRQHTQVDNYICETTNKSNLKLQSFIQSSQWFCWEVTNFSVTSLLTSTQRKIDLIFFINDNHSKKVNIPFSFLLLIDLKESKKMKKIKHTIDEHEKWCQKAAVGRREKVDRDVIDFPFFLSSPSKRRWEERFSSWKNVNHFSCKKTVVVIFYEDFAPCFRVVKSTIKVGYL